VLRRLLNESRPKAPKRQELMKAREGVEMARFRVDLLLKEKARKVDALQLREKFRASLKEENEDRGGKRSFATSFVDNLVSMLLYLLSNCQKLDMKGGFRDKTLV
jgi:hypothetical protein